MGETVAGIGNLEVSVSFGRFENDLLSWERWSSFSQNKYLEEIEKCSTPGSVAEKKAYFEAHYKKIAAKKAEIEVQQKQFEATLSMATRNNGKCAMIKNEETYIEHKQLVGGSSVDEKQIGKSPAAENSEIMQKQLELDRNPLNNSGAYPIKSTQRVSAEFQSSYSQATEGQLVKEVNNNFNTEPGSANIIEKANDEAFQAILTVGEESNISSETGDGFVGDLEHESRVMGSPQLAEASTEDIRTGEILKSSTEEMTKLKTQKITKILLKSTERSVTKIKKAPLSVTPKSPPISSSTPKKMMPASVPSMMSTSRSSVVKGNISSASSIKSSYAKHKKVTPRTDTVSLSPGLAQYAPVTATRKSTIMEKMRDKDVIKRAFKPFQPNPNPMMFAGEQSDPLPKQVLRNAKETKVKEILTSQKGKEWLHKTGVISANVAQTVPHLANSRTDTMTHKGKQIKMVSRNPNVKVAAGFSILAKSKDVNETAAKDLHQSRRFKARPLPAFYRGTGVSESIVRMESPELRSTDKHQDTRS